VPQRPTAAVIMARQSLLSVAMMLAASSALQVVGPLDHRSTVRLSSRSLVGLRCVEESSDRSAEAAETPGASTMPEKGKYADIFERADPNMYTMPVLLGVAAMYGMQFTVV